MNQEQYSRPATLAHILCLGLGWFPNSPGGLDRYVYELVHHLAQTGNQIDFCGLDLPTNQSSSYLNLINIASANSSLWQRLIAVRHQVARSNWRTLDAVNPHFALYSLPILDLLPKHIPVTFTFHGPWALESQQEGAGKLSCFLKLRIEKQVYQRCDRFITLSRAFGKILHQTYGVSWDKIHVIPGGVDINRFQATHSRQEAQTLLGWPTDRAILFTPRRLVQRMGLDKLLIALAQVKQVIPDVWLAIAGKGPLRPILEQQVKALGLEQQVKFLGFVPDDQLSLAYQAADLCIVPSQTLEGFGLILLESLASGTPVLCTPVGGMPEIIAPLAPQLITASLEATDLAERLIDLLLSKVEVPSRAACRQYTVTNFNWYQISQRVRTILLDKPYLPGRDLAP